jgi:hypothetical protein
MDDKTEQPYRWAPLVGDFAFDNRKVVFRGGEMQYGEETGPAIGDAISDQWFAGGVVSGDVVFKSPSPRSACDLILAYNPATHAFVSAGISNEALFSIRHFHQKWNSLAQIGDPGRLIQGKSYQLEARVRGSLVTLRVDGVEVCAATVPGSLPRSQVGVWCRDFQEIEVSNFAVQLEQPRAFVVMQFTTPYNELFQQVVRPICAELGVAAVRADDSYGPGLIIADVARQIDEAKFVVAEITPVNPNVYYEVGYAHARNKPTILIADRKVDRLPFDVSPFRTLFYENSIDGKRQIDEGLRRHVRAILDPSGTNAV